MDYAFLQKYVAIIEPKSPTELSLFREEEDMYTRSFKFKVCSSTDSTNCQSGVRSYDADTNTAASTIINFDCKPYDIFDVTVEEMDSDHKTIVAESSGKAVCLYVRREIRSLSSEDREAFLSSAHTLWTLSDEQGKSQYGSSFHSVSLLLKYHHFNAGQQKTDHIHNGNGVILQHIKFTNLFESSLQLVDPSAALPYWEFTADNSWGLKYDNDVLTAEYFGSMHVPAEVSRGFTYSKDRIEDGAIQNGRWAQLTTPFDKDLPSIKFAYGYMRAPWNLNPSPYVSRFAFEFNSSKDQLPTCAAHYTALQNEDMMDFFFESELEPHGGNHMETGGVFGCDMFDQLVEGGFIADADSAKMVFLFWVPAIMKGLFRLNYVLPQSHCDVNSADIQASQCSYECDEDVKEEIYNYVHRYQTIHLGLEDMTLRAGGVSIEQDQDKWIEFICGGDGSKVFVGDNYESSSPKDPSFWVMHPTLERLLQAKLMAGGFFSEEWFDNVKTQHVCDYARCYDADLDTTDYFEDCCYGHFEDDRMLDISGSGYFGPTNSAVLLATDPRYDTYSMPYIYDSFSWSHCEEDFEALLTSMAAAHK